MLFNILAAPVSGPLNLTRWVCGKIQEVVEREVNDEDKLKSELIELQMKRELEEMTEVEFVEKEDEILSKLEMIRKSKEKG